MLFMFVGWHYDSKLPSPPDLLFIPQMTHDFEEPRCNDIEL
jgi:hypothetical protein